MDDDQHVVSHLSFFLWHGSDNLVSVCDPSRFPPGPPSVFLTFLDYVKNDTCGKGGPRAMAADPRGASSLFCTVTALRELVRRFSPLPGGSTFGGLPVLLADSHINYLRKVVAVRLHLDPSRLLPHGLRVAGPVQLSQFPDAVKMAMVTSILFRGCWHTHVVPLTTQLL